MDSAGTGSATSGDAVLVCDQIVAGYLPGIDILRGCSVRLNRNEIVGIVGPNGAGKSTLLKAIFGLIKVTSGTVSLGGEDITGMASHQLVKRGVAIVPQRDNVFSTLTVEENLEMGLFQGHRNFAERYEAVAEIFPRLAERRRQRAGSLSGGERQMVAFGRALMPNPEVLLLDEPSAGLSPALQTEVFERVQSIRASNVSVLMVEQNARRCLEIADRAYVLDQGVDAHSGSGGDLLSDPKVIDLYLGTLGKAR